MEIGQVLTYFPDDDSTMHYKAYVDGFTKCRVRILYETSSGLVRATVTRRKLADQKELDLQVQPD